MLASLRQRWVKLLLAAPLFVGACEFAAAQESRDWNVRRAPDDSRSFAANRTEPLAPQYAAPHRNSLNPTPVNRADLNRSLPEYAAPERSVPNHVPSGNFHSQSAMPREVTADSPAPAPQAPRRPILPVTFSKREDRASTVVRGNNSTGDFPLPLAPPKERSGQKGTVGSPAAPKGSITTIVSSLAVVLGAFFLVVWCARRANPHASAVLPKEVVETLGRTSIGNRQYLQLVRVGSKLLLLSITPHGTETLTEITSNDEVERLTGLCQQHQPGSVTTTFRNILAQLGNEPTTPGFLGDSQADELAIASSSGRRRSRLRLAEEGNA